MYAFHWVVRKVTFQLDLHVKKDSALWRFAGGAFQVGWIPDGQGGLGEALEVSEASRSNGNLSNKTCQHVDFLVRSKSVGNTGRGIVDTGVVLDSKSYIIWLIGKACFVAVWRVDWKGATMKDSGKGKDWARLRTTWKVWRKLLKIH
jgi:hypothetical protein